MSKKSVMIILFALLGTFVIGLTALRFYDKQNKPFKKKYKKEIEIALSEQEINSIDYAKVFGSGNVYLYKFTMCGNSIDDLVFFDTVKAFNTLNEFTNKETHPMYHKNFTIEVSPDKNYSSCFLIFKYNYEQNSLSVEITNSTVCDFFHLNDIGYTAIDLSVIHNELFDLNNILKIKNIKSIDVVDCYNMSGGEHNKIVLDENDIYRLKEGYPNIVINNS